MNTLPKKPIVHTLIGIAVFLLVAQPQVLGGSFVLLFLLLWLPYTAVHGIYSRKRPKLWCIKFICWLAAFAAAYAMFAVYNHHARLYAQTVVDDLNAYHAKHGHYPSQTAWQAQQGSRRHYRLHYICLDACAKQQEPPLVLYASALSPFDRYLYDFKTKTWNHVPD